MEFHEKLQELRKQRGMTQEELAEKLYVSRTAISKWESGRGYPNLESLKAISNFFSLPIDRLLSGDEIVTLAEDDYKQKSDRMMDLVFGLLDLGMAFLFFFPFFAQKMGDAVGAVSLFSLTGSQPYLKILYLFFVFASVIFGILTFALQGVQGKGWIQSKRKISLGIGTVSLLLFVLGLHPYAAVFAFALVAIKGIFLLKKQ